MQTIMITSDQHYDFGDGFPDEAKMAINAVGLSLEVERAVAGRTELPSGMVRFELNSKPNLNFGWPTYPQLRIDPSRIKPRSREEQIQFWNDYKANIRAADEKYHRHQLRQVELKLRGCRFLPGQVIDELYREARKSLDKTGEYIMRDGQKLRTPSTETVC